MKILEILSFLFLFLFITTQASLDCSSSRCEISGVDIHYPFRQGDRKIQGCVHPGFNLSCNPDSKPVVNIRNSGDFIVKDINYLTRQIHLSDPDNCIAGRLLSLNLSGSPFTSPGNQNYTFLNCPAQVIRSRYSSIDCLSNSTTVVLATPSMDLARSMLMSCEIMRTLAVPVSWPVHYSEGFSSKINDRDLRLTWDELDCGNCQTEARTSTCGSQSRSSREVGCLYVAKSGKADTGVQIFRILCLSIAAPAAACAVGIGIFACCSDRMRGTTTDTQEPATQAAVAQQTTAMTGLDESAIDSYQKVVLGESRRLPGPNDSTCPICLSEYCSKEIIRCIPECDHCFHADCIDEWLRIHNTCPICRNSPSPPRDGSEIGINSTSPPHDGVALRDAAEVDRSSRTSPHDGLEVSRNSTSPPHDGTDLSRNSQSPPHASSAPEVRRNTLSPPHASAEVNRNSPAHVSAEVGRSSPSPPQYGGEENV